MITCTQTNKKQNEMEFEIWIFKKLISKIVLGEANFQDDDVCVSTFVNVGCFFLYIMRMDLLV